MPDVVIMSIVKPAVYDVVNPYCYLAIGIIVRCAHEQKNKEQDRENDCNQRKEFGKFRRCRTMSVQRMSNNNYSCKD